MKIRRFNRLVHKDVWLCDPADTSITKYCMDTNYRERQRLMCDKLFGSIQKVISADIPFEGLSDKQIIHILFEDVGENAVNKELRDEIRRWHPDKFKQKLGVKFVAGDKDLITERVKIVSQALNGYAMCLCLQK
jgi:hypothetical protein